eukprot:3748842-Rhodomonas_salina.2
MASETAPASTLRTTRQRSTGQFPQLYEKLHSFSNQMRDSKQHNTSRTQLIERMWQRNVPAEPSARRGRAVDARRPSCQTRGGARAPRVPQMGCRV